MKLPEKLIILLQTTLATIDVTSFNFAEDCL